MKIGVNATCINSRPSGARQRFLGLFGELTKQMPESEFVFFEPEDCRVAEWFGPAPNVSARRTPLNSERRWQRFLRGMSYWPQAFARERFDIFEALHLPVIRPKSGKTLLTIHDVRGLHPEAGWLDRQMFRKVLAQGLRSADHVVTVSNAVRDEILAFSTERNVSVVYNGLDTSSFEWPDDQQCTQVRLKHRLPDRFVLSVGHFEPRKNYLTLIDAIRQLHLSGEPVHLVIVGNDSGERRRVEEHIRRYDLASSVHLLSGLTDTELRCVYRIASLLVFPSRYEGFGIPLIEAMAASKPIAASDIPVFREILLQGCSYFHPDSAESITQAIRSVLGSGTEQARLIAFGSQRVRDFEFGNLAAEMMRLYHGLNEGTALQVDCSI